MEQPFFTITADDVSVEPIAVGELTVNYASVFRSNLIKLLQHGKGKAYKLNLMNTTAMDDPSIQLIYILRRELSAVDASLIIALPTDPYVKEYLIKIGFTQSISYSL